MKIVIESLKWQESITIYPRPQNIIKNENGGYKIRLTYNKYLKIKKELNKDLSLLEFTLYKAPFWKNTEGYTQVGKVVKIGKEYFLM